MKKLLFLLSCVLLLLLASTAPALAADYFSAMKPGNAYVHPWMGNEGTAWWEGVDKSQGGYFWSQDPIPAGYTVWLAAWVDGWPKDQMAALPWTQRVDCEMTGPGTTLRIGSEEARTYWDPVFFAWRGSTIYADHVKIWVSAWKYRLGTLPVGDYSGTASWTSMAPYWDYYSEGGPFPLDFTGTFSFHFLVGP